MRSSPMTRATCGCVSVDCTASTRGPDVTWHSHARHSTNLTPDHLATVCATSRVAAGVTHTYARTPGVRAAHRRINTPPPRETARTISHVASNQWRSNGASCVGQVQGAWSAEAGADLRSGHLCTVRGVTQPSAPPPRVTFLGQGPSPLI